MGEAARAARPPRQRGLLQEATRAARGASARFMGQGARAERARRAGGRGGRARGRGVPRCTVNVVFCRRPVSLATTVARAAYDLHHLRVESSRCCVLPNEARWEG
eukprot:scaffold50321_cov63-Phaeocystis_antarctica.AAC.2